MQFPDTQLPKEKLAEFYAGIKELHDFQKKPVLDRCMFWSGACNEPPIGSHLLARSWLGHIADNTNHVVQIGFGTDNIGNQPAQIIERRMGISNATTFPGFCEKHDSEMFACLETSPFTADPEQLLALRYRSVCREACAKHQMVGCHLPRALDEAAPSMFAMSIVAEMRRCILLLAEKQALEEMMGAGKKSLASYVVRFARIPSVLASATIHPLVTFTGRALEFRQEWITVSVIPTTTGGWAVFSWLKNAPKNSSLLVKSFTKVPREFQTEALLNLVFEASENHAISPTWWASISDYHRRDLMKRFGRSFAVKGDNRPPATTLAVSSGQWVDWLPAEAGYV